MLDTAVAELDKAIKEVPKTGDETIALLQVLFVIYVAFGGGLVVFIILKEVKVEKIWD